jgi:outer membrane receptor protein involved in Fe transport
VELSDSPRWNANLVVTHAPPTSWYSLGGGVRWVSSRLTGGGNRSNDAVIADARFSARILTSTVLGLEVKNLFNTIYSDPVTQAPVRDPVLQDPRTIYLTFSHQAGGFRQAGSAQ